jgi:hypothetical protein
MRLTLNTTTVLPGRRHDRRLVGVPRDVPNGRSCRSSNRRCRRTKVESGGIVVFSSYGVDERMRVAAVERLHNATIE